nr:hypothetical protein [uncultured Mediterranean phage uvMED]
MLLITPSALIKQPHSDTNMADALSMGLRSFEGLNCPVGKPPECIFSGGNIELDTDDNKVLDNPSCPVCGLTPELMMTESSLDFDSEGRAIAPVTLSLTGSQRNRREFRNKLTEMLLNPKFELSANAQGQGVIYFEKMLDAGFHKGGTGLDAVTHTSIFLATRFDYNFVPLDQIVNSDSILKKKINRLVKRAINEKVIERPVAEPLSVLNSVLARKPQTSEVEKRARELSKIHVPGLRPQYHAAASLYMALRENNSRWEEWMSQESVGEIFHIGRKSVGLGYKAITERVNPKDNPPPKWKTGPGLTASQIRQLRKLR